ncbi:hypothetical protein [Curtobacterium flaccumfaciens]|nr:hypothetical protein [Curtobacterium flaccumfaciens]
MGQSAPDVEDTEFGPLSVGDFDELTDEECDGLNDAGGVDERSST